MPGPFPGMDPYLESRRFWQGFHNGLIFTMQAALNAELPPGFAANYEERVYLVPLEHSLRPDVLVYHSPAERSATKGRGATAVLEPGAPHGTLIVDQDEVREGFIEIRTAENWDRVITIIEVLSPTNKAAGSEGRDEYLRKQHEVLRSKTHLMEIDLLRGGVHTVSAPLERLRERGNWDYLVCLHRGVSHSKHVADRYHYWLNTLREPLPPVLVPLTEDVPEVLLDLQAVFDQAYDAGPYTRLIDYREAPPLPLEGEDAAWADALLREKGLR